MIICPEFYFIHFEFKLLLYNLTGSGENKVKFCTLADSLRLDTTIVVVTLYSFKNLPISFAFCPSVHSKRPLTQKFDSYFESVLNRLSHRYNVDLLNKYDSRIAINLV